MRSCVVCPKQVLLPRTPELVWLCFVFKLLGTHANEELIFELFNIRYVAMQAVLSSCQLVILQRSDQNRFWP